MNERLGNYVAGGHRAIDAGQFGKGTELFEMGGDFKNAAKAASLAGQPERAIVYYELAALIS